LLKTTTRAKTYCEETADSFVFSRDQHDPFVTPTIKALNRQDCGLVCGEYNRDHERCGSSLIWSVLCFFLFSARSSKRDDGRLQTEQNKEGDNLTIHTNKDETGRERTCLRDDSCPLQEGARSCAVAQTTWREVKRESSLYFEGARERDSRRPDLGLSVSRCPANCSATTIRSDWLRSF